MSGDSGEVRIKNESTGGEKGQKLERHDLLPVRSIRAIARHFGVGARKYEDRNWERGYNWSLSYGALQRHLTAWWGGEDLDEETGSSHLAAAGFHVLALLEFLETHPGLDDRPTSRLPAGFFDEIQPPLEPTFKVDVTNAYDSHEAAVDAVEETLDTGKTYWERLNEGQAAAGWAFDGSSGPMLHFEAPSTVNISDAIHSMLRYFGRGPLPKYRRGERVSVRDIMKSIDGTKFQFRTSDDRPRSVIAEIGGVTLHEDAVTILDALEDAGFQITKS